MKKILLTFVAVLCCMFSTSAQDVQTERNQVFNIKLGNVQYAHHGEKLSTGEAIGKVLTGVATGQVSVQATKYEEDVKNAIIKGPTIVLNINIIDEKYLFSSFLVNATNGLFAFISVTLVLFLDTEPLLKLEF